MKQIKCKNYANNNNWLIAYKMFKKMICNGNKIRNNPTPLPYTYVFFKYLIKKLFFATKLRPEVAVV